MWRMILGWIVVLGVPMASRAEVILELDCDKPWPETWTYQSIQNGQITRVMERPGAFIYDPLTKSSRPNLGSYRFQADAKSGAVLSLPLPRARMSRSFTIEMYIKLDDDPRRTMFAIHKARQSDDASTCAIGPRFLNQFNQTYISAWATPPKSEAMIWSAGHYVSIARITRESLGWRHLAIVHDAERRTMTLYHDYWQVAERTLERPWQIDDGLWTLGGAVDGNWFAGHVDALRVHDRALTADQFLRARPDALAGVDFRSPETVLPRGAGWIDVREGFGAVGDGKTDDTAAFQRAFDCLANKIPAHYFTLYIPPGEYLISKRLWCSRFTVLQGAGRDRTRIRLKDDCPGFDDPKQPEPVLRASSYPGAPGTNQAVNGSSIGIYLFDLSIDTGNRNPGAKGIEYHSNNHGSMIRVDIRSGDGNGVVGLDLTHKTNGPALIQDVRITGFDFGITSRYMEYSLTLERIDIRGAKKAAILNEGNILAIHRLQTDSAGPALISKGTVSMVTLIDADLNGPAEHAAIESEGALYVRNLHVKGFTTTIRGRDDLKPIVREWISDPALTLHDARPMSLGLPIEDAPEIPRGDLKTDWVSIESFADKKRGNDWGPAIQAALDSGKPTIYFPNGGYEIATPVKWRGQTVRLRGMKSHLHRAKTLAKDQPIIDFAGSNPSTIERMDVAGLHHSGPGTMVLWHSTPERYTSARDCGKLFMYDVAGTDYHFDHPQNVWVRQWNPESHDAGPNITSKGAHIWALGFKTEYESSKLWAFAGAKTEILGGFIYPVVTGIPKDRPIFKNVDSSMSLIYGLSVYVAGHDLQVWDQQRDRITEVRAKQGKWIGARMRMDLFRSEPPR